MQPRYWNITSLIIFSMLLVAAGCKKDSSTGPAAGINADLFPIVQGRVYVYTESDVDAQNAPVSGTDHRVATMVGPSVTLSGRTGNYLIDSVYSTNGRFSNFDTLNVVSKGSDGTLYFTLAPIAISGIPLTLTAVWFPLFQPGAGVGNQYQVYTLDTTIAYQPGLTLQLKLTLKGIINQPENVQVPAGTFSAYRGDITYEATSNGITLTSGTAATMWLAEGIGPVKILYPALNSSTTGTLEVLLGKNF